MDRVGGAEASSPVGRAGGGCGHWATENGFLDKCVVGGFPQRRGREGEHLTLEQCSPENTRGGVHP